MLYFKINDYITLKLEHSKTNIYVKGKKFNQCKYLLLNVSKSRFREYDAIKSIDEAAERLSRSMEGSGGGGRCGITPQTEFWGHCSNIQAWAENKYDTRLLHRNLAFPLLRRLADEGDPIALRVFKEEIAMRLVSGHPTVVQYLSKERYLNYLTGEEITSISEERSFLEGILRNYNYFVEKSKYFRTFTEKAPNLLPNLLLMSLSDKDFVNFTQRIIKHIKALSSLKLSNAMGILLERAGNGEFYSDLSDIINLFGLEFIISRVDENLLNSFLDNPNSPLFNYLIKYDQQVFVVNDYDCLDLSGKNITDLSKLEGLEKFAEVKRVVLDNNNISEIMGLEKLYNVEESCNDLKERRVRIEIIRLLFLLDFTILIEYEIYYHFQKVLRNIPCYTKLRDFTRLIPGLLYHFLKYRNCCQGLPVSSSLRLHQF